MAQRDFIHSFPDELSSHGNKQATSLSSDIVKISCNAFWMSVKHQSTCEWHLKRRLGSRGSYYHYYYYYVSIFVLVAQKNVKALRLCCSVCQCLACDDGSRYRDTETVQSIVHHQQEMNVCIKFHRHFIKYQKHQPHCGNRESVRNHKPEWTDSLFTVRNVCRKFHWSHCGSCWDISAWTKVDKPREPCL